MCSENDSENQFMFSVNILDIEQPAKRFITKCHVEDGMVSAENTFKEKDRQLSLE